MRKFPKDLLDALLLGEAVGLIGAGPSISAGVPNWSDLLKLMISECEENIIDFQEGNELRTLLEEGMFLLVAEECRNRLGKSLYRDFMQKIFRPRSIEPSQAHKIVCKLPFTAILTTNYDKLLEQAYSESIDTSDIPPVYTHVNTAQLSRLASEKRFFILKMHGDGDDIENLILTQKDYQEIIHKNQAFNTALSNLCANRTLVIIGYGLRDLDLNLILSEHVSVFKGFGRRHFAFVMNPGSILPKSLSDNFNITVIPYEHKENHSKALEKILLSLLKEVNANKQRGKVVKPLKEPKIPRSPYKFLDYYDIEDKDIFFGREKESNSLLQSVISHKLIILFGQSGVGKTSLLKASILPRISVSKYLPIYCSLSSADFGPIMEEFNKFLETPLSVNRKNPKIVSKSFLEIMKQTSQTPIFILDQFERVFIKFDKRLFNDLLDFICLVLNNQRVKCHLIISIREDYFVRLNDLASFIPSIFNNRFQLFSLKATSAKLAITKPAEKMGIQCEDAFVNRLIRDLDQDGIEPPQLQIICTAVFNALPAGWKTMDLKIYEKLGGAEKILSGYIRYVLSSFRDDDRDVAREVLKCLVGPSRIRTPLTFKEFIDLLNIKEDQFKLVLDTLVFHRLIRAVKSDEELYYELAHEYLIPQIDQWISDEERESRIIREVMERERTICNHLNTTIPLERARFLKIGSKKLNLSSNDCELIERSINEGETKEKEIYILNEQLRKAQKMEAIGTLTGGIAHDFNNMLMGIQGNVSLVLLEVGQKHKFYQQLRNIERTIEAGASLTKQLLRFARGGKYEVKPTHLNKLIKNTCGMFGRTKKELTIHEKYQKDLWTVEVDQSQIEQVLLNLFVNAWQAMPGGGTIFVETSNFALEEISVKSFNIEPGKYVKIIMTDTGIGMNKETLDRIFDPFFTTKDPGKGTGLGLSSVYCIFRQHSATHSANTRPPIPLTLGHLFR